jgi:hypothetical protein
VRDFGLEHRDVGEPDGLPGLVDARLERLDGVEEEGARADDREVLLTRPDHCVAGFVGAQLRVDEVDLDGAPGQLAFGAVLVFGERLHTLH